MDFHHISVLPRETIDSLNIRPDGIYVDGTLGGGGHASLVAASTRMRTPSGRPESG